MTNSVSDRWFSERLESMFATTSSIRLVEQSSPIVTLVGLSIACRRARGRDNGTEFDTRHTTRAKNKETDTNDKSGVQII